MSGLCGSLVILLIIYLFYLMLTVSPSERERLELSSVFQLTVLWVTIFGCSEIYVLAVAHQTNTTMVQHRGMVTQHVLRARRLITAHEQPVTMIQASSAAYGVDASLDRDGMRALPTEDKKTSVIENLNLFIETAGDVVQTLEVMEDMWPARVVGFKVDKEHVASAFSAMILFLFTVINFCTFGSLAIAD